MHIGLPDFPHLAALIPLVPAIFLLLTPGHGVAGGFQNFTQSGGAAAVATAGQTAIAEDAATIFYNPAGMALLREPQVVTATGVIFPQTSFQNHGTVDALGNPVGGTTKVATRPEFLPSLLP